MVREPASTDQSIEALYGNCLPVVRFPKHLADEIGNKCCGALCLLDRHQGVIPVTFHEWVGINALMRDDEL